jgi:YfiH family protein
LITPQWPGEPPARVRALQTTRIGGVSAGPWASFNLAGHVGDEPAAVAENRRRLRQCLPTEPTWLTQVHGTRCVEAGSLTASAEADASFTRRSGVVCAVLTADCLPLLLCDAAGSVVAAVHAGWRGLSAGVIEASIAAMDVPGAQLLAWLGPAIGPQYFEVGDEVRAAFVSHDPQAAVAFRTHPERSGKCYGDLQQLAQLRLQALGVCRIASAAQFFSYRRDKVCGRMASLIWLAD